MTITINLDHLTLETIQAITREIWKAQDLETFSTLIAHLQKRIDPGKMRMFLDSLEPVSSQGQEGKKI